LAREDVVTGTAPGNPTPHDPEPLRPGTRKRAYLVMMGVCLLLIILAWTVIYRYSDPAAIAMSAVALVVPPFAAIIANSGSDTSRRLRGARPRRTDASAFAPPGGLLLYPRE
jgi:hypothetical protein